MPKLRNIVLFALSSDQFNIDTLGIRGFPGRTDDLGAFIARSKCTVYSLKLVPVPYLVATTENILIHIPTLKEVEFELSQQQALDPSHLLPNILSVAMSRNGSNILRLLPSLQTMTLWTFKLSHTLLKIVHDRRRNFGPECSWHSLRFDGVMEVEAGVNPILIHIGNGLFKITLNGRKLGPDHERFSL